MTDVKPKKNMKRDVKHLFDEDSDDDDYIREALEKAAAIKARKAKHTSDKDVQPDVDNNSESDIEMHEAMAKALSTMPRRGFHSRRSSAASYSSGQDLLVPESDVDDLLDGDEDDEEDVKPVVQQKKPRKVSAARQKQADLEKPQVQPTTQHAGKKTVPGRQGLGKLLAADTEPALRPEDSWHVSARIIYPMPGKDIGLNSQSEELKAVLRGGIDLIKTSLLFEDAYPAIISRAGFARTYLVAAADALPAAVHIRERLPIDLKYAAVLADILLDRVNILRGNIKKAAVAVAPGFYGLVGLSPTSTKERVDDLLKDHRYIFPVEADTGRLKSELPFHNPALRAVLKDGVFIGQFKTKNQHLFISTSKKHVKNLELPDSMVSLTGTAVRPFLSAHFISPRNPQLYASLLEYRLTGERQNINFTEGAYEDTYRNHMKTLADTRAAAPVALHKVLHSLYNEVTEAKAAQPEAGSSATLINLVDIPESD
ncbi:hypothetical protein B0H10DRAFT_300419 [Mycena sp. CBHHK59/15]|nr:hypothetical protein B0H10DRAFT_300419 [Mycena sp. CBHHK59/15]